MASHGAAVLALMALRPPLPPPQPQPVMVTLVQPPAPADTVKSAAPGPAGGSSSPMKSPAPVSAARPAPSQAPPRAAASRPSPTPAKPLPVQASQPDPAPTGLSDAAVAGAAEAGSGAGLSGAGAGAGGGCDMAAWLQAKIRRDPLVQAAIGAAHIAGGRNILVWNGDWVQSGGEDGKGLAAVREAIMWEVAFAPELCRTQPVRGLVLLSLNEAPGSARLVVGAGAWRWADLLGVR